MHVCGDLQGWHQAQWPLPGSRCWLPGEPLPVNDPGLGGDLGQCPWSLPDDAWLNPAEWWVQSAGEGRKTHDVGRVVGRSTLGALAEWTLGEGTISMGGEVRV